MMSDKRFIKLTILKSVKTVISIPILLLFLFIVYSSSPCAALNDNATDENSAYPFYRPVTLGAITLYQKLISPARRNACPMYPHCSRFGYEAFASHNPLSACVITADRLIRCGQDLTEYPRLSLDGEPYFFDPVPGVSESEVKHILPHIFASSEMTSGASSLPPAGYGENVPANRSPDSLLLRFAQDLQKQNEYDRAITEYMRLLSYYPDSPLIADTRTGLLKCYYANGLYSIAVDYGENLLSGSTAVTDRDEVRFLIGASLFREKKFQSSGESFESLTTSERFGDKAIMMQGLSMAYMYDWSAARKSFERINEESPYAVNARMCTRLSREATSLGYRSPTLAGVLGIVPGLGYLYAGYPESALSALIVNGLFIWSAYEAYDKGHNVLGATLTLFGFGWYAGNIYGSANSAVRHNDRKRRDHLLKFDIGFKF